MSDWTDAERLQNVAECIEEVGYRWHLLEHAKTLPDQAEAITGLANAISDLKSWHPGYDDRTGMLPWEREAE